MLSALNICMLSIGIKLKWELGECFANSPQGMEDTLMNACSVINKLVHALVRTTMTMLSVDVDMLNVVNKLI